jgi:putative GTP pyrophosphokinase
MAVANGNRPTLTEMRELKDEFTRFMMSYKFGIDELMTKITILREEFGHIHDYNPIEHVSSRLKTPESIIEKAQRKGCDLSFDGLRSQILDIAGVRVTCSFLSDVYRVRDLIANQRDVTVISERDYIANPKANGYKSLHLIVEVPVFMSDRIQPVIVEIQIRTVAMDFWASLEHKIYYKYNKAVPDSLIAELTEAAAVANRLDVTMERIHNEVLQLDDSEGADSGQVPFGALEQVVFPDSMLTTLSRLRGES